MKLIPSLSQKLLFAVFAICIFLVANSAAQDFKTVHDGVEYAEVMRQLADKQPVKINLLRLDLTKVRLDIHHALDKAIGVETTSSVATRHGAVAAINAGFFRLDKSQFAGDAAGILMINRDLISESVNDRVAIAIRNDARVTDVRFGHPRSTSKIAFYSDGKISVSGLNRERKGSELILYKHPFSSTTLTDLSGTEVVFKIWCQESLRSVVQKGCNGFIVAPRERTGNTAMQKDQYVASVAKSTDGRYDAFLKAVRLYPRDEPFFIYNEFTLADPVELAFFNGAEDITNGVPQLIKDGKIDITWQQEKASRSFVETRHPRTAVAKLRDGKFLMMTVDGRQPGVSVGMNLYELADYLLSLGAMDAMNLDGGGSTTMFLDGKVVNKPSDKEGERKVGDAILVTLRKRSKK